MKLKFKSILSIVLCFAISLTAMITPITANAVSGSFTGGEVCNGYRLKIKYSESELNHKKNTSKVTATLYLVQDSTYDLYISTRSATITINGTKTTISNIPAIQNTGGVTTKLGSASKTITHNSDGTKKISIAGTFDMNATLSGTYYGTMSTKKVLSLDELDRTKPKVTLKFDSATETSVKLTATANATCDKWEYSKDGGSNWVSFGSEGKENTFTIKNLSGGTAYSIIARARKTKNNLTSASSSAVTATTKPKSPGSLKVDPITQTSAKVSWAKPTGANSYKVYLNDTQKATGITNLYYNFTGLTANTKYTFGVIATGTSGDSTKSSVSATTLPNVPTGLKVTNKTDKSVTLSWSYNNGGGAITPQYVIYRNGTKINTSTTTSYTDNTYGNNNVSYSVSAQASGESAKSSAVSVTYVPLSITLNATNKSTYATITPSFSGGLNRAVDTSSYKWAYGNQNTDYFEKNGYAFTDSFAVLQNGTYTVFAKDTSGNKAVGTIVVSGIYTKPTKDAFIQTFTDLSVDSIGLPISFERTYNSIDNSSNIFGNGWSLNYAKSTKLSDNGDVRIVSLPDGTINYFSVTESGFVGIKTQNKLVANENMLTLTTKDRTKYIYEDNYLTRIEDANGNAIEITLNEQKLPSSITDSVGRIYTVAYTNNKITSITDPAGRVFTYVYDDNGNLVQQKQGNGTIVNSFEYSNGLLTNIKDNLGNSIYTVEYINQNQVAKITDTEGSETYYLYKITSNGDLVVYESDSKISTAELNSADPPANNTYNPFEQIIVDSDKLMYTYNEDGTVSEINGEGSDKTLVTYSYDENGNVVIITTTDANQRLIEESTYTYSYFEGTTNIETVTETIVTNTYDDEKNTTETDVQTITSTYYSAGNLLSETTAHNDDDNAVIYTYAYDNRGLLLSETSGNVTEDDVITVNTTTEYTYDENGYITNIKTIENGIEKNTSMSYNVIGQILSQTEEGLTTTNLYDLSGNVIKVTQSDGTVTRVNRVVYDINGQVLQKISDQYYNVSDDGLTPDDNGICSVNAYNNGNVGERYTYDVKGNVLTYINNANNKTVNIYDSENRLVKTVTYQTPDSTENALTTRYVYDAEGNLIQTVYPHQYNAENDNLDVSNNVNEYADNTIGERVTYDENGNVLTYIDSFGKETVNTYDSNNNLVKSVTGNETTRFVYNGGDKLLQVIYPNQYNPDDDNLDLTAEPPVDTYANANVGDRYTYDGNGNISTYTNQYGEVTTNSYDADGNLTSTTKPDGTVFTFDEDGRAKKETYQGGLVRDFTYTSNQTVISGSNGITVTYNLNSFGEVAEYKLLNGENNKDYSYTYDSDGNITTISLNGSLQQTFTYNSSNELVRVDDAVINKTVTYDYDYVGNITSVKTYIYTTGTLGTPLTTQNYTYNSQNQRTDLSYDANGNMASLNGFDFTWDGRKLSSAISADTNISYTYNHNGIRTSKTVNGTTITYKVDENNNVIEQTDGTNTIKFVYDSNNAPVYFIYNNTTYYYEKNLQGDIVAILDANGNTVVEYTYDIWGKLLGITGELADTLGVANPLRYRGYYYDTETGLYYLQSRYYSPDLMRFISQDDPVLSNDQGEPLGSNLYAYCLNNPVMNVDETGSYTTSSLKKKSWMFKLASMFGINLQLISKTVRKSIIRINLYLVKLYIYISVGLTRNYKAGIAFNYSKSSVGVSYNTGLGKGYSIAYSYTLSWTNISRSMSLVYCSTNDGVYASMDVEFKINHLATAAAVAAAVYWPQISPVVAKMLIKSKSAAVTAISILTPIIRWRYAV